MFSWVAFQLCLKIYYPYHIQSSIIDLLTVDFKASSVFLNTKHYMLFTSYCLVLSRIFQSPLLPFPFKLGSKFRVAAEQWRGTCQILLTIKLLLLQQSALGLVVLCVCVDTCLYSCTHVHMSQCVL